MKCNHCGRENESGDICKSCGAPIETEAKFVPATDSLYWYKDVENESGGTPDYRTDVEKRCDLMRDDIRTVNWRVSEAQINIKDVKEKFNKLERQVKSLSTVVYVTIVAISALLFVILMLQ